MDPKEYISASDGNGEAVQAIVTVDRAPGDMDLITDSVFNWPAKFVATSGSLDPSTGLIDPNTMTVFRGHLTGSIITIEEFAPGYSDLGHTTDQIVVLKPSTYWADILSQAVTAASESGGGGGAGSSIEVVQVAHGFAVGDVLRSSGTDGAYAKAQADSEANAEVIGIVTVVTDADNFTLVLSGKVDVAAAVPNQTAGTVLYLSDSTAGALTATEPSAVGSISKPVAVVTTADAEMVVFVMRGMVIDESWGTSSFVSDETPTGLVNSSNTSYSASGSYTSGTLEVFINGLKQIRNTDYTETTPSTGAFTMTTAPTTGDIIRVNYMNNAFGTGNADTVDGKQAADFVYKDGTNLSTFNNPYKFYAYRSGAWTATPGVIQFETELFDTNNNYDTSTYTYTVPIDGYYQLNFCMHSSVTAGVGYYIYVEKNGSTGILKSNRYIAGYTNASQWNGVFGAGLVQLTAGDTLQVKLNGGTNTGGTGSGTTFFSGFLVSGL